VAAANDTSVTVVVVVARLEDDVGGSPPRATGIPLSAKSMGTVMIFTDARP